MGLLLFSAVYFRRDMFTGIVVLMIPAFLWNVFYPSTSFGIFIEYWIAFALGAFGVLSALSYRNPSQADAHRSLLLVFLGFFPVSDSYRDSPWRSVGLFRMACHQSLLPRVGLVAPVGSLVQGQYLGVGIGWARANFLQYVFDPSMRLTSVLDSCSILHPSRIAARIRNCSASSFHLPFEYRFLVLLRAAFSQ